MAEDSKNKGRGGPIKMLAIIFAALAGLAALAHEVRAAGTEPAFVASVDGVSIYSFSTNGMRCVVTTPSGSVSCK
jgi:hypothetical protein